MNKNAIPNIFTFINLTFGMLSIMFTFTNNLSLSAVMILCAAFVDRYDGRIARKINAESIIGKELDSLADLISFGAAPAILSWSIFLIDYGIIGYIITILFPIAGALRLAKYNVSTFNNVFTGMPITIAGSLLAVYNLFTINLIQQSVISLVIMIILSYLMVSKIKIKKF
jgi:CDP-diacylglycerol--serine O-phosphatidyltransferase